MIVNCKNCNKKFKTYPSRTKIGKGVYCSKMCWAHDHTIILKCAFCGNEYTYPKSQNKINYCSKECMKLHRESKKKEKTCQECGKKFTTAISRLGTGRGKFCSPKCYWNSLKLPEEILKEHRRKYTREYRRKNTGKTAKWKHKRRALQKNAGGSFTEKEWSGLKSKYNDVCAKCGKHKKLTVDHIISLKEWSKWIKENDVSYCWNDIENIQPLCINCNSQKSWLIK